MIEFKQIGVIYSPFNDAEGMPIQAVGAEGVRGTIELFDEYVDGLKDLDGFSHVILLYHFHRIKQTKLQVVPFLDENLHGIFATRAPNRPNPIGLSVVRLLSIEGRRLFVENIDVIDGTPLLDIKPYVPDFDNVKNIKTGWLRNSSKTAIKKRADGRFK